MNSQLTKTEIYKEEIFTQYLQLKKHSAQTREGIIKTVRRFIEWSEKENLPLMEISYNDVMTYVSFCKKQGNKPRTLQINVNNVKKYFNFLLNQDEVKENPCSNIEIRGVKRKTLYETFSSEELETIYRAYANMPVSNNGMGSHITHKRNKVIVGLIIYQGLRTQELAELKTTDILLQQGKIKIEGAARTEGRELQMEAFQLYDLMDYLNETRKLILALSSKQTDKLFTSIGSGERFSSVMHKMFKALQKQNPRLKEIKQLRASVITNWLKTHNIRKVQYMAGHRYAGSTEAYQVNNMDDLKEDVNRYHPNL